ncbi:hypothetical protein CR51_13760 [Caballeronia megalochromosomata]|nr:hypothetical protein CR51_13760 [Caballeronia megalochromosomata]
MNDDEPDDKTVIVSGAGRGNGNALPPGTRLAEFEIVSLIGEGGFGIVYLAHDTSLQRRVAIKEYMPAMLASRIGGTVVEVKSERLAEAFDMGLKSFINEARLLARFDHPSLVKVFRFWENNGTAYMAMPFYEGATLRDTLRALPAPPSDAWLRALIAPLAEAIGVLHREHCWHRDIAPDNIMLLAGSGRPVLLDFGSARRVIGDMTQALTAFLKPGYAPIEQYAEVPALKQGPWSDVYALGALVYFAILGKTPPPAVGRIVEDSFVPLAQAAPPGYSAGLVRAVDNALALWPDARPRNIDAFEAVLNAFEPAPRRTRGRQPEQPPRTPQRTKNAPPAALHLAAASRPRFPGLLLSAALAAALLMGPGPAGHYPRPPMPANDGGASGPLVVETNPAQPPAPPEPPKSVEPVGPPEPPPVAWTPLAEFERISAHADPAMRVHADVPQTRAVADRDKLRLTLTSAQSGYVYLFMVDADGQYLMLFPNLLDHDNAIAAGRALTLPGPKWPMVVGKPLGEMQFLALVSRSPRVFHAPPLAPVSVFGLFDPAQAPATLAPGAPSPYAGEADCGAPATACSGEYGVARFKIDVVRSSN